MDVRSVKSRVKQTKANKLLTPCSPLPYAIIHKEETMIIAQYGDKQITRNSSHFKPIHSTPLPLNDEEEEAKRFCVKEITSPLSLIHI